jgi:hypothetical protein
LAMMTAGLSEIDGLDAGGRTGAVACGEAGG